MTRRQKIAAKIYSAAHTANTPARIDTVLRKLQAQGLHAEIIHGNLILKDPLTPETERLLQALGWMSAWARSGGQHLVPHGGPIKIPKGAKAYHIAPARFRDQVRTKGLLPGAAKREIHNRPRTDYHHTRNKIFLGTDPEEADLWAEDLLGTGDRPLEPYDLWEIDLDKVHAKRGRLDPFGDSSFYITGTKIRPQALKHRKTYYPDEPDKPTEDP
jgi:hypothetical protein